MSDFQRAQRREERAGDVEFGFADLFDVLLARKWTVLAVALVVMAASVFSSSQQRTTYSSNASVVLAGAAQTSVEAQQLLATGKQLAHSRSVAAIVAHDLRLTDSPEDLLAGLSVIIPLDTQLIEFQYAAASPREATRLAQAFVDAFMKYQKRLLDGLVASARSIDQLTDSLRSRLATAQTKAASATNPADVSSAKTEVDSLTAQISRVEQQRTAILTSAPIVSTLAERASPAVRNAPPLTRGAAVGLIAGIVLGAFAAFALEYALRGRRKRREGTARVSAVRSEVRAASSGDEGRTDVYGGNATAKGQPGRPARSSRTPTRRREEEPGR